MALLLLFVTIAHALNYSAASLQHNPVVFKGEGVLTRFHNLDVYEVHLAKATGAQIMVFPELGLGVDEISRDDNALMGEFIPDPNEDATPINPCDSPTLNATSPALVRASCMARKHSTYLVMGCIDVQPCDPKQDQDCPPDKHYIYNAAIALDDDGNLIQKYHKYHLFFTLTGVFNIPKAPQVRYFDAPFGRFGMFICFEIMFYYPAVSLVNMGIKDFVFPTSWNNVPPIVTANQMQQAWSRHFGTSLIAANNGASGSVSGSGIYHNGEIIDSYFDPFSKGDSDEKLLSGSIPISPKGTGAVGAYPQLPPLAPTSVPSAPMRRGLCGGLPGDCTIFTPTPGSSATIHATSNNVSCTATYTISAASNSSDGVFALFATDSLIWFSQFVNVEACGIVHCVDKEVCIFTDPLLREVYKSETVFESLRLSSNLAAYPHVFPLVATRNGQIVAKSKVAASTESLVLSDVTEPLIDATLLVASWKKNITMY